MQAPPSTRLAVSNSPDPHLCGSSPIRSYLSHLKNNHVPCGDTLSFLKQSRYVGVARHRVYKFQKLLSQGPDLVPKRKDGYVWILLAVRDRKGLAELVCHICSVKSRDSNLA